MSQSTVSAWVGIPMAFAGALRDRWATGGWLDRLTLPLYGFGLAVLFAACLCIWGVLFLLVDEPFAEPEHVRIS